MIRRICLALAFCCLLPLQSKADLVLEVVDSQIVVGGSGFVDVLIRSNGGNANVSLAAYQFTISSIGVPVGSLEFSTVQLTNEQADLNYLFSNFQPTGNFTATATTPLIYTGGDFTNDPADFAVVTTNRLLARLEVHHVLPANTDPQQAVGSQFNVSFNPAVSEFWDENGNPIANVSSIGGVITAVPEPSSLLLILVGGAGYRFVRNRRRTL